MARQNTMTAAVVDVMASTAKRRQNAAVTPARIQGAIRLGESSMSRQPRATVVTDAVSSTEHGPSVTTASEWPDPRRTAATPAASSPSGSFRNIHLLSQRGRRVAASATTTRAAPCTSVPMSRESGAVGVASGKNLLVSSQLHRA